MVLFDLWGEAFIFAAVYSLLILVPCVLIGLMGRKMIIALGTWPTRTPAIQMSIFLKLVVIEAFTFFGLIAFFQVFSGGLAN